MVAVWQTLGVCVQKSLGSRSDPRVTFTPDEWQIKLLDVVDRYDFTLSLTAVLLQL